MSQPLAIVTTSCRLSNEPGRALLAIRGQHEVTDSPLVLGGPNEAPNPVELMLSSLAACAVFICERAALELGIPLKAVSATAAGEFDPRGVCGEAVDPRIQTLRVRLTLQDTDVSQSNMLIEAFKTRCPVYATLARAVPIEIELA